MDDILVSKEETPTSKFISSVSLKSSMNSRDHSKNQTVVLKVKDEFDNYYIIYRRVEILLSDLNGQEKDSKEFISGIQIYVCHSIENITQVIPFTKIKTIVEKAFRLLVLSYHTSFSELSKENKELFDENDFMNLRTFLLKLGIGVSIEFVSYYNPTMKVSDPLVFQKELPSIFDSSEKSTFIHTGSEKIDIQGTFDDFILMFDRQSISGTLVKNIQEYLTQQITRQRMSYSSYKNFITSKEDNS